MFINKKSKGKKSHDTVPLRRSDTPQKCAVPIYVLWLNSLTEICNIPLPEGVGGWVIMRADRISVGGGGVGLKGYRQPFKG
jgi:hypothetical protein